MNTQKIKVHFIEQSLLQPANPITVNLIGAGGTGSHMLTALAKIHTSLLALQHPGLFVRVFDGDVVTAANIGRQLFAASEIGLPKAVALINRYNRHFGTDWKAVTMEYNRANLKHVQQHGACITISCVDKVQPRFEIASILQQQHKNHGYGRDNARYWMDFGNSRHTGQAVLATIGAIKQPASKKFIPVGSLPFPTVEFKELFEAAKEDNTPSCSLAEALIRQDLFINPSLADLGGSVLWQLLREGVIENKGFFLNLRTLKAQPLKVA